MRCHAPLPEKYFGCSGIEVISCLIIGVELNIFVVGEVFEYRLREKRAFQYICHL